MPSVQCKSFIVAAFETKSSCLLPCLLALEIWRVVFSSEVGCQYKSNTHPSAEAWFYCYDFVSCTGRKTGFKSFPSCGGSPPHWRGARSGLVNDSTPRRRYYEQRTSKQKQQTFHDLKMIFFFISSNKASDCCRQATASFAFRNS